MFFRILLWAVIIFFLARFVAKILWRLLQGSREGDVQRRDQESSPKEEYQDVRDAKYVDVADSKKDTPPDRKAS